ncbi:hypothetical protein SASPL_112010 [Salvia splendens]|uniref:Transmembrane protein n=1 Tax=Salvia splendens TaxID=180675 RepID=A0A8X8Y8B1_SALSN|nr:hypothetical protein SASPL_112010 [Salvia splendens]
MQFRKAVELEVEPPSVVRYLIGAAIMMLGVVLPVGYMMFRNKRVPSSSSYSKQTLVPLVSWKFVFLVAGLVLSVELVRNSVRILIVPDEQGFDIEVCSGCLELIFQSRARWYSLKKRWRMDFDFW